MVAGGASSRTARLPARALAPVRAWLDGARRRRAGARRARPPNAHRRARQPARGASRVVAGALAEQAATAAERCAPTSSSAYARGARRGRRGGHAAARCCAARCWPAGTTSSGTGDLMRALESRLGAAARPRALAGDRRRRPPRPSCRTAVRVERRRGRPRRRRPRRRAGRRRLARAPAGRALLAGRRRLDAASPDLLRAHARGGARVAGRRVRAREPRGRRQALDRALRLAGRQRRGARGDARRVRPDRRADRRRGRRRGRHVGGRPAGARGAPRRPGRAHARRAGARGSCCERTRACSTTRRSASDALLAAAPQPGAEARERAARGALASVERAR